MSTSISLPPMYYPGSTRPVLVVLKVCLVNADHEPIIGFGPLHGYALESTFQLDGSSEALELPPNSSLQPLSLWRFRLESGSTVEDYFIDLEDGLTLTLSELLYGALSS